MLRAILLTALLAAHVAVAQEDDGPILTVPGYGTLLGRMGNSTYTERPFYGFRSVFYADPPTPETRFLPPKPRTPYDENEIVNATVNNAGCPQPFGQEDCLSLDVFTPSLPDDANNVEQLMPVMVWIHGGSFRAGQALEYLPGRFMESDIVVVVIQYRLGPLGFLCFDTDEVPGNAGIFDQIEALRWVQKHIRYFGGNPDLVTIAGESAGSASVSTLLLAPQAKGLFHRAIGESGSILAEWALDRDDRGRTASLDIARRAGCPLEPYDALVNCVKTVDARVLTEAYQAYRSEDVKNGGLGFSGSNPVIQKAGKERAIESEPTEIFASGNYSNVPIMFGANKQEGVLVLSYTYIDFLVPNNLTENATFLANDLVPVILKSLHIRDDTGALADAMVDKYLADAEMGNFTSMTPGLTDMCSVLFLKSPGYETVRLHSQNNPHAYWYSFNFEARHSMFTWLFVGNWPPIPHGVGHADEMMYIWIYPFPTPNEPFLNATEMELSLKMLQVWTNFITYGDPTPDGVDLLPGIPKFEPYNRQNENYMAIDLNWEVKSDYKQTYTVTVDELPLHENPPSSKRNARKPSLKSPYLP